MSLASRLFHVERRMLAAVIGAAGLSAFLLPASPAAAGAKTGCTASFPATSRYPSHCDFIPTGTTVKWNAKASGLADGFVEEYDPTCTTDESNGSGVITTTGQGSFTLRSAGDCVLVGTAGYTQTQVTSPKITISASG